MANYFKEHSDPIIEDYIKKHGNYGNYIICDDGFNMYVRKNIDGFVDVKYPSEPEIWLMDFVTDHDDHESLTNMEYKKVPVEIVDYIIKKHKGIKK